MKKLFSLVLVFGISQVFANNVITVTNNPVTNQAQKVESGTVVSAAKASPKKHKVHKRLEKEPVKNNFFDSNSFDFSYNGDVANLPLALRQYDASLVILPSLGNQKPFSISLDLSHTTLNDIQNYVANKTDNRAKLVYDHTLDSIRVVYDTRVTVANDAVKQSQVWQDGGAPSPVLNKDGLVLFPYGQYEPKLTCQTLQLCDIQLEAGEIVKGLIIGDTVRWNEGDGSIPIVYSGSDSKPVPHIVLKPTDPGLDTTLLVTTDKRTYYMKVYSSNNVNVSRVGFYYPGEEIQQLTQNRESVITQNILNLAADTRLVDPKNIHFNYDVSGDTSAPFNPVQVFDDGKSVFIQMPADISGKSLPSLFVVGPDDQTLQLVNFIYKSPYYIVNKLFDKARLTIGTDDNQQSITITRKNNKSFWANLVGA